MAWVHLIVVAVTSGVAAVTTRFLDKLLPFYANQAAALIITSVVVIDLFSDAVAHFGPRTAASSVLQTSIFALIMHDVIHHALKPGTRASSSTSDNVEMVCQPCEEDDAKSFPRCDCPRHAIAAVTNPLPSEVKPSFRLLLLGIGPFVLHVAMDGLILGMVRGTGNILHTGLAIGVCILQDTFVLSRWLRSVGRISNPRRGRMVRLDGSIRIFHFVCGGCRELCQNRMVGGGAGCAGSRFPGPSCSRVV